MKIDINICDITEYFESLITISELYFLESDSYLIDWDLPFIPRKGECINGEILNTIKVNVDFSQWECKIEEVAYNIIEGKITPSLFISCS